MIAIQKDIVISLFIDFDVEVAMLHAIVHPLVNFKDMKYACRIRTLMPDLCACW